MQSFTVKAKTAETLRTVWVKHWGDVYQIPYQLWVWYLLFVNRVEEMLSSTIKASETAELVNCFTFHAGA